ncbi:hypothetical protein C3747_73g28 [Trypanosoma cruzi]|uniref:Uncharacterized protein n=2 Tax=Trypanosoma cruzi TaxID=5693 RepID=Q4DHZ1_TRYCC|nr:hypothetical protein, conserved [Trypanosoma cruzi]EAN92140.1 hypothetical protein, conserved [Trypanosoma cruzi]PWV09962.1 hypothetical protein C3747_73g28 [Trypanosoma cruzi]RNC60303.1 hypothetical protein TcCL_ESM02093 [Trypanosoma cruzi]|eukprot:XP_813991.1 hypothetical protein [Trypanosoma cruzi strain CL Brener]
MPGFNQGFSAFIDNYILLLAARFHAPLDAVSFFEGDPDEPWEKVAHCVRDALLHPQTEDERREVAHVDFSLFDAQLCRERALYFTWRLREEAANDATKSAAAAGASARIQITQKMSGKPKNRAAAPSQFDITRDSLRDEVERIYTAVRKNLPSTFGLRPPENGAANNSRGNDDVGEQLGNSGTDEDDDDDDEALDAVEFSLRSEEEMKRDVAIAEAREALLVKIQEMQAEFFAQHRRWIDVPFDIDVVPTHGKAVDGVVPELPPGAKAADHQPLSKSAMREALAPAYTPAVSQKKKTTSTVKEDEAESPLNAGIASPAHLLEALRRSIHVNRPPRPSQMREEDYEADYGDFANAPFSSEGIRTETEFGIYQKINQVNDSRVPQENSLSRDSLKGNVTFQTTRASRWSILEYDGEADEDSDDAS